MYRSWLVGSSLVATGVVAGFHYKIGNKLTCLQAALNVCERAELSVDYVLFLDSDMVCLSSDGFMDVFKKDSESVLVKAADYNTWGGEGGTEWSSLYNALGVNPPTVRAHPESMEGACDADDVTFPIRARP